MLSRRLIKVVFTRCFTQNAIPLKRYPCDYPIVKGSEHWKIKMCTFFKAMDANRDGYTSKEDYELSAQRVAHYLNLDENNTKEVLKHRLELWEAISKGAENSNGYRVSQDKYISDLYAVINTSFRESFVALASRDFDAYDLDGDGFISPKEHEVFFYGWGIPIEHSTDAFKALDTDGDGLISREEFIQAGADFMFSEEESSPYKHFLGPLIE